MRIDDFVMQKISVLIQTDRLASVTESRVYRHCPFLAHRCSEKQLAQVFSENTDRLLVGLQLELLQYFFSKEKSVEKHEVDGGFKIEIVDYGKK